jgi:hypothetical protein
MPALALLPRRRAFALALLALLPVACQAVGAEALATGRAAYNEVITRSGDEQLLALIVRDRYDETFGLLQVASVTAQVEVGAGADVNVPVGPLDNFAENLVPFAAGASYTESPTISYVPLSGEALMTRLVAPLSLTQALVLQRFDHEAGGVLRLAVRRANGLANALRPGQAPSPAFRRVAELLEALGVAGTGDIVSQGDGYGLLLRADPASRPQVRELLELLGLRAFQAREGDLLIPVRAGIGAPPDGDALVLESRSILEILRFTGHGIEVPEEHLAAGLAEPPAGPATDGPAVRVRSSRERPRDASVAVRHRDWWFSIDASDTPSKRGFVRLRALVSMGLESAEHMPPAPMLTLPVGS